MKKHILLMTLGFTAALSIAAVTVKNPIFQKVPSGSPSATTRVLAVGETTAATGQQAFELTLPQLAQWSDGDAVNPQLKQEWLIRGQTLDTTPLVLSDSINGGFGVTLPASEHSTVLMGHIVGRVGTSGLTRAWEAQIVTTSLSGVITIKSSSFTDLHSDSGTSGWIISAAMNGGKLEITATGSASQEVMWSGYLTSVSSHFTAFMGDRCWDSFVNASYGWTGRQLLHYYDGDGDGMPTIQEWAMLGDLNSSVTSQHQNGFPFVVRIGDYEHFVTRVTVRGTSDSGNLTTGRSYQCVKVQAQWSETLTSWASIGHLMSDTIEAAITDGERRLVTSVYPSDARFTTADVVINSSSIGSLTVDGSSLTLANNPYSLPSDSVQLETDILAAGHAFTVTGTEVKSLALPHSDWRVDTFATDSSNATVATTITNRKTKAGIPIKTKQFIRFLITKI